MLLTRRFLVYILCGFIQYGNASQAPKTVARTAPKLGEGTFFSSILNKFRIKPPQQISLEEVPAARVSNEDALFGTLIRPRSATSIDLASREESSEDKLFLHPLPTAPYPYLRSFKQGKENHGDDELFSHPLTPNATLNWGEWFNEKKQLIHYGITEMPVQSLMGVTGGAAFGAGSGMFFNKYVYPKVVDYIQEKPHIIEKFPKFLNLPKFFNYLQSGVKSTAFQRAVVIKSMPKPAAIGFVLAITNFAWFRDKWSSVRTRMGW